MVWMPVLPWLGRQGSPLARGKNPVVKQSERNAATPNRWAILNANSFNCTGNICVAGVVFEKDGNNPGAMFQLYFTRRCDLLKFTIACHVLRGVSRTYPSNAISRLLGVRFSQSSADFAASASREHRCGYASNASWIKYRFELHYFESLVYRS